jgi:mannose-6-phosphate isomerase
MLYPFTFQPIFKERIWGGRNLERLYGKQLPQGCKIGESWEITDRPEGVSVIANGPLRGKDLRWLMKNHLSELLGDSAAPNERFPLLVKILDAQEKLSLQVHPPASVARELAGEPKTEMWYITDATPEAELYVGLKRGITKPEFARRVQDGTVADCFHRVHVQAGDAMFLPSGRVHAIGAGNVIFEIQQNSDTTYRVFDWNRVESNGRPRDLHIAESLASINFDDFEPDLITASYSANGHKRRELVADRLFEIDEHHLDVGCSIETKHNKLGVLGVISGVLRVEDRDQPFALSAGGFALVPAASAPVRLTAQTSARFLEARPG